MTMTLDEVRKTRFHMSRRNGYEVTDVDIFVDKVEATLVQLTEQNDHLLRQLEAAQSSDGPTSDSGEVDRLRGEVSRLRQVADQVAALQQQNNHLRGELEQARTSQGANEGVLQENQRLQALVDTHGAKAADADRLARENEELAQRNEALAQEKEGLAQQHEGLSQENGRLRQQLEELQSRPERVADSSGVDVALPLRVTTAAEASAAVVRLVQLATEQAEALVSEAKTDAEHRLADARAAADRMTQDAETHARQVTDRSNADAARVTEEAQAAAAKLTEESQGEAQRRLDEAAQKAHEVQTDARTKADRIESEARVTAERVTQDAQSRADGLDREVAQRRAELFTDLESQRDELRGKVDHLHAFEGSFRATMADYLRQQVATLEGKAFQPGSRPALLDEPAASDPSSTPRLDALLHES